MESNEKQCTKRKVEINDAPTSKKKKKMKKNPKTYRVYQHGLQLIDAKSNAECHFFCNKHNGNVVDKRFFHCSLCDYNLCLDCVSEVCAPCTPSSCGHTQVYIYVS